MPPAKKLQVFVSSTYTDLREERQAAVEAILSSGHIPAGMELFAAGDESQMDVIRRWIDESDVFLLILGGRYGSIEPKSGKSYIHLEYEYATERGKLPFAVVLNDVALDKRVKKAGRNAIEIDHAAQFREFRALVLSKMVRFWSDVRDIKLAIYETMNDYARRTDLAGWVPGDQAANVGILAEEIARMTKENADLRRKISETNSASAVYSGLSFDELLVLLEYEPVDPDSLTNPAKQGLENAVAEFGASSPSLVHMFWMLRDEFVPNAAIKATNPLFGYLGALGRFGLLRFDALDRHGSCGGMGSRMTEENFSFAFVNISC